jgi:uncharacterized protein
MIPDFTLRIETANGRREVHLEIVGFWTPEYLSRKVEKLRQTDPGNMIIAVSKQLALNDEVAEELNVLWFDRKLKAADVVEQANMLIV